jgi:hypothetical protein
LTPPQEINMDELLSMVAAEQEPTEDAGSGELPPDVEKRLAEQLRQMIKDGMTDECSICLSDFDHPVQILQKFTNICNLHILQRVSAKKMAFFSLKPLL